MDFARATSIALNMKAMFPMHSELMKFPPLRMCAGKTLLVLAVLRSNANDFHVPYARVPRFEPTRL
jgi:hypothetical protein